MITHTYTHTHTHTHTNHSQSVVETTCLLQLARCLSPPSLGAMLATMGELTEFRVGDKKRRTRSRKPWGAPGAVKGGGVGTKTGS